MGKVENRIAVISIVVRDRTVTQNINDILSRHGDVILGRLGVPCPEHGVSIIVILINAENPVIGAIGGAIGNLPGVTIRSSMLI
ncbi:MAG: CopG family transcriptional regulator [Candidatus Latescibacteria bacterium]|nr:CopG family transcriptional regulator [Candidatus Latescibacterota bacterium]